MKTRSRPGQGQSGGAEHSGAADTAILPESGPCHSPAECVTARCHILLNGDGDLKAFICRAHALVIRFDKAAQA